MDWDLLFLGRDVDQSYTQFVDVLSAAFEVFVPRKKAHANKGRPPWSRAVSSDLIRRKKVAWRNYKDARGRCGRNSHVAQLCWFTFRDISMQYKLAVQSAVSDYEVSLVNSPNLKRFHGYLRCKKVSRPSVGPLLLDDRWITSPGDMADCLAEFFSSVFVTSVPVDPQPHQESDVLFRWCDVTVEDVRKILVSLKQTANAGPDGLPSVVLNRSSGALCYPLCGLFRKSIAAGKIPMSWRCANVLPLFKGGTHSVTSNYRPISNTSVVSKVLERLVVKQLYEFLESCDVLSPAQFGFRPGRSVADQLLLTYDYVTRCWDAGEEVDVVFFDYRKAFDVVHHQLLLTKLELIGVCQPLLGWIGDFLANRSMNVVVQLRAEISFQAYPG